MKKKEKTKLNKTISDLKLSKDKEKEDVVEGSDCCGQPTVLSPSGIVFECLICGGWYYASS